MGILGSGLPSRVRGRFQRGFPYVRPNPKQEAKKSAKHVIRFDIFVFLLHPAGDSGSHVPRIIQYAAYMKRTKSYINL